MWIASVSVLAISIVVFFLSSEFDRLLNPCGLGTFKDGSCDCSNTPYTGSQCEIVNCGFGELINSIWNENLITTPIEDSTQGCQCTDKWWGRSCSLCNTTTSGSKRCLDACKGPYYGPRCSVLCKEMDIDKGQNDPGGHIHQELGGIYNWYVQGRGICDQDGSVICHAGFTGDSCEQVCDPECKGKCVKGDGQAACECDIGFSGPKCDESCLNKCNHPNGVCTFNTTVELPQCKCDIGFALGSGDCGVECCIAPGRGTCNNITGVCECMNGFEGPNCKCHENSTCYKRGVCAGDVCQCHANYGGENCLECKEGWVGSRCDIAEANCDHGTFLPLSTSVHKEEWGCICDFGFGGDLCDECHPSAYPKSGDNMCTIILRNDCHPGKIQDMFDGTNLMCDCTEDSDGPIDGHFDSTDDCKSCLHPWVNYPYCDVECGPDCENSGGACTPTECNCGSRALGPEGKCVDCFGDSGCSGHGECLDIGRKCKCDVGYFGENCDASAPKAGDDICSNAGTALVEEYLHPDESTVPCTIDSECTSTDVSQDIRNRLIADMARSQEVDLFCYKYDVPSELIKQEGCCEAENGRCSADGLTKSKETCSNWVDDICVGRILEGEVEVYEWCLAKEIGCTSNGECSDPVLCKDMCSEQNETVWIERWENEHLDKLFESPWHIGSIQVDPFLYRDKYTQDDVSGICESTNSYDTCRDHLKPECESCQFNVADIFYMEEFDQVGCEPYVNNGIRQGTRCNMPSYASCPVAWSHTFELGISSNHIVESFTVPSIYAEHVVVVGDARVYVDTGHTITNGTIVGSGQATVALHNSVSPICVSFIQRAASDWDECKDVVVKEMDMDWSEVCEKVNEREDILEEFDNRCYLQSRACEESCVGYQEECVGLPLDETPLPEPCHTGWENFCDKYMQPNIQDGVCSRVRCDCKQDMFGTGGPACQYTCGVPPGDQDIRPCGEGLVPALGRCGPGTDDTKSGLNGRCECFFGGDPNNGCANTCDSDVCGTPTNVSVTITHTHCDFKHLDSYTVTSGLSTNGEAFDKVEDYEDSEYNKDNCSATDSSTGSLCLSLGGVRFLGDVASGLKCTVFYPQSICNALSGGCEGATPFTLLLNGDPGKPFYINTEGNYRAALMQGNTIDTYLPFTKHSPEFRLISSGNYWSCSGDPSQVTTTMECSQRCENEGTSKFFINATVVNNAPVFECYCSTCHDAIYEHEPTIEFNNIDEMLGITELETHGYCLNNDHSEYGYIEKTKHECANICIGRGRTTFFLKNEKDCACGEDECDHIVSHENYRSYNIITPSYNSYETVSIGEKRSNWNMNRPVFQCFKDLEHTIEINCQHMRALHFFSRRTTYRTGGNFDEIMFGAIEELQIPCNGRGSNKKGTCICDFMESLDIQESVTGLAFGYPELTQTAFRGAGCEKQCPGYDYKNADSICSGNGVCTDGNKCICDKGWTGYKCHLQCESETQDMDCHGHGTCEEVPYPYEDDPESPVSQFLEQTTCDEANGYLRRDRVIEKDGITYWMFADNLDRLKVREYKCMSTFERLGQASISAGGACTTMSGDPGQQEYIDLDACKQKCLDQEGCGGFSYHWNSAGRCRLYEECSTAEFVENTESHWESWIKCVDTREATISDFDIYGKEVRGKREGPYMACEDTISIERESEPKMYTNVNLNIEIPSNSISVECSIVPGLNPKIICGSCSCFKDYRLGHWTGYDCRTPASGYYTRRANKKCPGMIYEEGIGTPCNGRGICQWGSEDGKGELYFAGQQCMCGALKDITLETMPESNGFGYAQVYAHFGGDEFPVYIMPVPLPTDTIRADNMNFQNNCACRRGFAGKLCDQARMTCLFGGTEIDGEACKCENAQTERLNILLQSSGCCPLGTYYDQERYYSSPVNQFFGVIEEVGKPELSRICSSPPSAVADTGRTLTAMITSFVATSNDIRYWSYASECENAEVVDHLYSYEYAHVGLEDYKVRPYDGNIGGNTYQERVQKCFEACVLGPPDTNGENGFTIPTSETSYGWDNLGASRITGFGYRDSDEDSERRCYCSGAKNVYSNNDYDTFHITGAPLECVKGLRYREIVTLNNKERAHIAAHR